MFIIALDFSVSRPDIYVAVWSGDPGRTYDLEYAKKYKTKKGAKSALTQIRKKYSRPFVFAKIIELNNKH